VTKIATASGRRWRLRHLIGLVLAAMIICGGGLTYVIYQQNQDGKAPTAAAEAFLNSLETNSPADAYLQLCSETKKTYSASAFTSYVKSQPEIESHHAVSVELSTVNGVRSAIVTESITSASGSAQSHGIVLTDEGGAWLVCGQPY
jgi:hypothetical protein